MADAVGARELHSLAHMTTETCRRDEPERQLAGMHADVDGGIKPAHKLEKSHVVGVVGHCCEIVFAADEVDPRHARIDGCQLKAEQRLGEHALPRRIAEDLIEAARFHVAGRLVRRPTVLAVASERVGLVEEGAGGGKYCPASLCRSTRPSAT